MSTETQAAELARLRAENEALKANQAKAMNLRLKVSEKGAVSLYGINSRFPITLYRSQWVRVISMVPQIEKFMADNKALLKDKV